MIQEVFLKKFLKKNIKSHNPIFWCMSKSKNVLRGLHLQTQHSQEKFVTVVKGKILDVVVDLRKIQKLLVSILKLYYLKNALSLLIPAGFALDFWD